MANNDYRQPNLSIVDMVFNRMLFLNRNDAGNITTIKSFIWEVMNELEFCFQVSKLPDGTVDTSRIGQEQYYTPLMQSIIADAVCVYVLMYIAGTNAQGTGGNAPANLRYLKRAKAGSAEVEWGQFSIKDGVGLYTSLDNLIKLYNDRASSKGRTLGCDFDICNSCTGDAMGVMPTVVARDCGCC